MTEGRTIAIGDVHGCSAALAALVRAIDPTALDTLVFLGDYIDRGVLVSACGQHQDGIRFGIRFFRQRPLSCETPFA